MESLVGAAVEAVMFEAVDVGLHGAVGVAEFDIVRLVFLRGFRGVAFAFPDPLGVGLEQRADLFLVRNGFALEEAPPDEIKVFVELFVEVGQLGESIALNGTPGDGLELGSVALAFALRAVAWSSSDQPIRLACPGAAMAEREAE